MDGSGKRIISIIFIRLIMPLTSRILEFTHRPIRIAASAVKLGEDNVAARLLVADAVASVVSQISIEEHVCWIESTVLKACV
jgi:hypothetical protein